MQTGRLNLVPFEKNDFEVFQQINTNSYVRKYLWDDEMKPAEFLLQILEKVERHFTRDRWGLWKIATLESSTVIGYVGLWQFFEKQQPQLLYALLPGYTCKGYATEAATSVIDYAFKWLKFSRLTASIDEGNIPSQKVCERLAFKLIDERDVDGKQLRFYELVNGAG